MPSLTSFGRGAPSNAPPRGVFSAPMAAGQARQIGACRRPRGLGPWAWTMQDRSPLPWACPWLSSLAPSGQGDACGGHLQWSACGNGPLGLGPSQEAVPFPLGVARGFRVWPLRTARRLRRALAMVLRAVTAHWALDTLNQVDPLGVAQGFRVWPLRRREAPAAGTRDGSACGYGPLGLGPPWTGPLPLGVAQGFRVWPLRGGFQGGCCVSIGPSAAAAGFSSFAALRQGGNCIRLFAIAATGKGLATRSGFATELGIAARALGSVRHSGYRPNSRFYRKALPANPCREACGLPQLPGRKEKTV